MRKASLQGRLRIYIAIANVVILLYVFPRSVFPHLGTRMHLGTPLFGELPNNGFPCGKTFTSAYSIIKYIKAHFAKTTKHLTAKYATKSLIPYNIHMHACMCLQSHLFLCGCATSVLHSNVEFGKYLTATGSKSTFCQRSSWRG